MDDESIRQNAVAKREAARAEADRWDDFIRMLDELAGRPGSVTPRAPMQPAAVRVDQHGQPRIMVGTGKVSETERLALEAIEQAGRPLTTRELLDALAARGVDVGGKEPTSTLSARLSRSEKLQNIRPYGWRPKEPPRTNEAADPSSHEQSAASDQATPNDAAMRGEVEHDNMT